MGAEHERKLKILLSAEFVSKVELDMVRSPNAATAPPSKKTTALSVSGGVHSITNTKERKRERERERGAQTACVR